MASIRTLDMCSLVGGRHLGQLPNAVVCYRMKAQRLLQGSALVHQLEIEIFKTYFSAASQPTRHNGVVILNTEFHRTPLVPVWPYLGTQFIAFLEDVGCMDDPAIGETFQNEQETLENMTKRERVEAAHSPATTLMKGKHRRGKQGTRTHPLQLHLASQDCRVARPSGMPGVRRKFVVSFQSLVLRCAWRRIRIAGTDIDGEPSMQCRTTNIWDTIYQH